MKTTIKESFGELVDRLGTEWSDNPENKNELFAAYTSSTPEEFVLKAIEVSHRALERKYNINKKASEEA